jgi:hypothetical protein
MLIIITVGRYCTLGRHRCNLGLPLGRQVSTCADGYGRYCRYLLALSRREGNMDPACLALAYSAVHWAPPSRTHLGDVNKNSNLGAKVLRTCMAALEGTETPLSATRQCAVHATGWSQWAADPAASAIQSAPLSWSVSSDGRREKQLGAN